MCFARTTAAPAGNCPLGLQALIRYPCRLHTLLLRFGRVLCRHISRSDWAPIPPNFQNADVFFSSNAALMLGLLAFDARCEATVGPWHIHLRNRRLVIVCLVVLQLAYQCLSVFSFPFGYQLDSKKDLSFTPAKGPD